MNELLLLGPAVVLLVGGAVCGVVGGTGVRANRLGPAVAVLGGVPAGVAAAWVLLGGGQLAVELAWPVPFGSLSLGMDALSAFFVLAIVVVSVLGAIYGGRYMDLYAGQRHLGSSWFFYNALLAAMLVVVTARNGVLFLVAWEGMSLASFFLVMFEHDRGEVRRAGWTYLIAMHLGTAFLLAEFALLAGSATTWDFAGFAAPASPGRAGAMFLLAAVGFGTKAGFLPLHVWLPEAHPAAPSHVSAVMSGVMIKTGIYGLLRVMGFLGEPAAWWGWTLLGIGAASGVAGVLMALAQHDLKRLLAYHSVENIGIICLGLGLGVLGAASGNVALAVLGTAGGLLHVWNHAIFKSCLFFGAGSVLHATGTKEVEQLGGLLKRMPTTGATFLVASAAICGLPPLNGFVSELLIYMAGFVGVAGAAGSKALAAAGAVAILALGLIGGLAAACFAKAFGVVFLGEGRSQSAMVAHEAPGAMRVAMVATAALCVLIGLAGPAALAAAAPVVKQVLPAATCQAAQGWVDAAGAILWRVTAAAGTLLVLIGAAAWLRRKLLAGRSVGSTVTWDCGYAAPTARMQYTASSLAAPIVGMFAWLLRPRVNERRPEGLFPAEASYESHAEDAFERGVFRPAFLAVDWLAGRLQWLQAGRNQLYILYIAATLLILLVWKLG
jgi:formate hydrogenlyase subunit 3/multisubunit Na+/H+ antiporter MnhD subunit